MRQAHTILAIDAPGQGLHPFTETVIRWTREQNMADGLLTLFCRHTSASLLIQENAAPAARRDIERYFAVSLLSRPGMSMMTKAPTTCPPICGRR